VTDSPQPVCAACGETITLHVRFEPDAVYYCDDSACFEKRNRQDWKIRQVAKELQRSEQALDYEPEEEESNIPVKPSGPYVGEKVEPGSAYDRKLIKLGVPKHVRAETTTDEARRMTPEMAQSLSKSPCPDKTPKYLSSADKDPGLRGVRSRPRPNLAKWAQDLTERRKAGIYDPDLDEEDKNLHFDERAFTFNKARTKNGESQTPAGTDHLPGAANSNFSAVHQDFGSKSYSVNPTDGGWRLDSPDWVKNNLDAFFRERLRLATDQEDSETEAHVMARAAIDREILHLYYREGLEDAQIYEELKERIENERGSKSKSPADYIKKRRQRLLTDASRLPGFLTNLKKAWRAIIIEYAYQTPDGEEGTSHFGEISRDLYKPVESLRVDARNRCKILCGGEIARFEGSTDRTFASRELANAFMSENRMEPITPEEIVK
jgi:hypothetical protein